MLSGIRNIAFAGAGNVAYHLAKGLKLKGFRISGIWSRMYKNASELAGQVGANPYNNPAELRQGTDLIIIAVNDKSIEDISNQIGSFSGMVVHTAGSVNMQVLAGFFEHFGIFYPLQTFSKEIPVNLQEVPFFIESNSQDGLVDLKGIALELSPKVYEADSQQRMLLHVAAVFACNYTNLMYTIGNDLLSTCRFPAEVLHPLIYETARKAITGNPELLQTGPAKRGDLPTLQKHLETLACQPEYADLYRRMANLIVEKHK